MIHLPNLVQDLALVLVAAGVTTLLFKWLKQPLVLGYIIAGLLVGSHIPVVPTVVDAENIHVLGEIGVIFLLFSLGLEFSFKKLMRVGGTASITAIVEVVCMLLLGYGAGQLMGWSLMDSIFLGGILSISSTTIIIRAFEELGVKSQLFAGLVFGVLIIEDLVAILLLVLLSTLAVSRQLAGTEMLVSVLKLVFFLSLWFIAGIFLLPTFLRRLKKMLNEETLLILSLGLCLLMVVLAVRVGFSPALGAFVMGSILAETTSAERIEHLVKPVKDLFAAVFFVSVGILIDPAAIMEYKWTVLLLTLLTILGKLFSTAIGALLSGQPLKQSVQAGMSLAQIGEFSFIIATLGLSLKVTSDFLYPIAVAISAITTFTTPYLIRLAEPLYQLLNRLLPVRLRDTLNKYSTGAQSIQAESKWKQLLKAYVSIILVNSMVILALILLGSPLLSAFLQQEKLTVEVANAITLALTCAITAPFFWALVARRPASSAYRDLWLDNKYNRGPLLMIEILRNAIAIVLLEALVDQLYSGTVAFLAALLVLVVVILVFSKRLRKFYRRMELRFLHNLHDRQAVEEAQAEKARSAEALSPWDAHLADFEIGADALYAGKTLEQLAWRERYGVNVAFIERGERMIYAPGREEKVFPFDTIGVIGTDQQMQQFRPVVEARFAASNKEEDRENILLQKIVVDENTRLKGLTIRASGIREKTNGLVVGIERNGQQQLNPPSDTVFQWDDIVWIVGDRRKIHELFR